MQLFLTANGNQHHRQRLDRVWSRRWRCFVRSLHVLSYFLVLVTSFGIRPTTACPFCQAFRSPISHDLRNAKFALLVSLDESAAERQVKALTRQVSYDEQSGLSVFRVQGVLKADALSTTTLGEIDAPKPANPSESATFLVFGFCSPELCWTTPMAIDSKSVSYLEKLEHLPSTGAERLEFFLQFLDHADPAVADDAYNEFALAPYRDLIDLAPKLNRVWLVERISDAKTDESRLRLYLTLLGLVGTAEDVEPVERLMERLELRADIALDATIACYVSLRGMEGLVEIQRRYLKNVDAAPRNTYSAIVAHFFLGDEFRGLDRDVVAESLAVILERPDFADLVIQKLEKWEYWTAAESIAELFRRVDSTQNSVSPPAVGFLRNCPRPEAVPLLAELEKIDPAAVVQSQTFLPAPPPEE